jgi:large repetitive protein
MRRIIIATAAVACITALSSVVFAGSALALTVTGFNPNSGLPAKDNGQACPGVTVMITGSGFVNDGPASAVSVSFNGTPVQAGGLQIGSDSTLYVVVPGTATTGPITVTDAAGSVTTSAPFYVNPCPQVALSTAMATPSLAAGVGPSPSFLGKNAVKPTSGKVGQSVTLTGYSFYSVTGVSFGSVKAKFTITSPTTITATVPKGAKTAKIELTYVINNTVSMGGINPNPTVNGNKGNPAAITYSPSNFKVST